MADKTPGSKNVSSLELNTPHSERIFPTLCGVYAEFSLFRSTSPGTTKSETCDSKDSPESSENVDDGEGVRDDIFLICVGRSNYKIT